MHSNQTTKHRRKTSPRSTNEPRKISKDSQKRPVQSFKNIRKLDKSKQWT